MGSAATYLCKLRSELSVPIVSTHFGVHTMSREIGARVKNIISGSQPLTGRMYTR